MEKIDIFGYTFLSILLSFIIFGLEGNIQFPNWIRGLLYISIIIYSISLGNIKLVY